MKKQPRIKKTMRLSFLVEVEADTKEGLEHRIDDVRRRIVNESYVPQLVTSGSSSFSMKRKNKRLSDVMLEPVEQTVDNYLYETQTC